MGLREKQSTQPPNQGSLNRSHAQHHLCSWITADRGMHPLNYECHFLIKTMNFTDGGGGEKKHLLTLLSTP